MIKFFRKIRQNLLIENKTKKYFKYAVGEIVLVVIGILIALQVSNWNTGRIDNLEIQKSIENLQTEFTINKQIISRAIIANDSVIKTGKHLMSIINLRKEELKTQNTDKLLFDVFENGSLEVTENSILEILQSNKLQSIKNDSQKNVSEKGLYLVNYLMKRYPLKNIDAFGVLNWKDSSNINIDQYAIFYKI